MPSQAPQPQQSAPAQAQPKQQEPARAARKPAAPDIAPIVKDMFASATSGTMRMSSWTAANPVKKAVEAAKTVSSAAKTVQGKAAQSKSEEKSGGKRRGGCLRFFLIVLLIIVVIAVLPVALDYIGMGDISEKIRIFFEDLVDIIIG